MPEINQYLQVVEYLGFLNAELRGLKGFTTLANELIQNAKDAKAGEITFDIQDGELVVENTALFADCGDIGASACSMEQRLEDPRLCDFHRFRKMASGNKRRQEDNIGAFGIGFISVYQITDRPEIISGNRHWAIEPTEMGGVIAESKLGSFFGTTRFILPWHTRPAQKSEQRWRFPASRGPN